LLFALAGFIALQVWVQIILKLMGYGFPLSRAGLPLLNMSNLVPVGAPPRFIVVVRDAAVNLFVLVNGPDKNRGQGFSIQRAGNDAGVHPAFRLPGIKLTEIQEKLEGVMPNLEVVGITAFQVVAIAGPLEFFGHDLLL
jgi:hypothetical protein